MFAIRLTISAERRFYMNTHIKSPFRQCLRLLIILFMCVCFAMVNISYACQWVGPFPDEGSPRISCEGSNPGYECCQKVVTDVVTYDKRGISSSHKQVTDHSCQPTRYWDNKCTKPFLNQ